jgi:geranylgeranyl transferase type-2 subunit alpha
MHGIKRGQQPLGAEEATQKKIAKYQEMVRRSFEARHQHDYAPEHMALAAQVLITNPELYTLWNYRKEWISSLAPMQNADAEEAEAKQAAEHKLQTVLHEEMGLLEKCIGKHSKSYGTWHHRRWVLAQLAQRDATAIPRELALCDQLLKLDARNFHCWNHRRQYAPQDLAFSTTMIHRNFSNYSAWHQRAACILTRVPGTEDISYASEVQLLANAFFTDPKDQSAWIYHLFILRQMKPSSADVAATADMCREIVQLEEGNAAGCKWPYLTLVWLSCVSAEERQQVLETLIRIDPRHEGYYRFLLRESA